MTARRFLMQYWLSLVWIGLAAYTLIVIALTAILYSNPIKPQSSAIGGFLVVGLIAALVRFFLNGGCFKKEVLDKNASDNFFLNLTLWGIQIIILVICWPFMEFFRQGRFLVNAYNNWKIGKILVDENGREIRAG